MQTADLAALTIRSAEPSDALAVSALLGRPEVFEGTLQMPDVALASRLEMLQRPDPGACKLVALDGSEVVAHAAALYRSLGFIEEGRHRGYALKDGRYVDAISMARMHPAPPRWDA